MNWEDCFRAYLLGKSIVGIRAEDIILCTDYLANFRKFDTNMVEMIAVGEVGVPALHAAFLYPDKFSKLTLRNVLNSWAGVIQSEKSINQLSNAVHGVLKYYDLPDLARILGDKVIIEDPQDAAGLPYGKNISEMTLSDEPEFEGMAGILYGRINFTNPESPDPILELNQNWDNALQKRGRDWASKWYGYLISPFDGKVEFKLYSNQRIILKLGDFNDMVLDYGENEKSIGLILEKDKIYPIRLEFSQDGVDTSHMKITWRMPGEAEKIITSEYLRHSQSQRFKMAHEWK
jgi:hypothetical protein